MYNFSIFGVAESWDNFAQFVRSFQWFQPPIHPAFMQRPIFPSRIPSLAPTLPLGLPPLQVWSIALC